MIQRSLQWLTGRLCSRLELRQAPSSDDVRWLHDLGIQAPRRFPAGPAPEEWPSGIPQDNRRGDRDRRFLPWNWCTAVLVLALWLLLTLALAMVVPAIEARHGRPHLPAVSAYQSSD